jgi:hypothetical protein
MSHTSRAGYDDYPDSTKGFIAFGVTTFAGVLLTMVSIMQILEGIAAVANDKVYVRGLSYTYEFDVTTWGWIHMILGIVGLATGIGILMGMTWGRILGIVIAGLSTVSSFAFMPYYPFWAMAVIALDVFVIWALCSQIANDDQA